MAPRDELKELLEEVDALFPESGEAAPPEAEPTPARRPNDEVLMLYRDLSYGQDTSAGPARNGDRRRKKADPLPGGPIPAYNADVRRLNRSGELPETDLDELLNQPDPPRKKGPGCVPVLLALLVLLAAAWYLWQGM